ncbi:MAG: hypothetical protein GX417_10895 [Clostridiales bacterium]|nr:hypothetical protein [Clostridiales bacterium]
MDQFLAILVVAAVAAAFYGVSYLKKRKMHPNCDRFALLYCELADRLLDGKTVTADLATEGLDGGLLRIRPPEQQPDAVRAALERPIGDDVLEVLRELFMLRDEIQAEASNGSFSKDKYNAITNQVFDSLNIYLSIVKNPQQIISDKDLDQFHYFLHKQAHIRNVTLPSIVSRSCAASIAL